jgi:hypothetical protein
MSNPIRQLPIIYSTMKLTTITMIILVNSNVTALFFIHFILVKCNEHQQQTIQ